MKTGIRSSFGLFVLLFTSGHAIAGPCDAQFSFDGNLSDGGGNGYDGQMVNSQSDEVDPQWVEGRWGQALQLGGDAADQAGEL